MPDKARVAVFVSGRGTNMAALLYASRLPGCPYEIGLVASNDPEAEALTLAEAEGVASRVRFLGWRTDRAALLRTADAVLVPSRHEPFGNVVVNAWAHDVPVIASLSEGPQALIAPGDDGLLTPIGDSAALAQAITSLLADSMLSARLVMGGQQKVAAEFSEPAVRGQYIEVFNTLLAQRR